MSAIDRQLAEDRAMRDAALRLFKADIAVVRGDVAARGVGGRVADRVTDAAMDTVDDAVGFAQDHRLQVAGGLAAILLFLFRGPILDLLASLFGEDEEPEVEDAEPLWEAARSSIERFFSSGDHA